MVANQLVRMTTVRPDHAQANAESAWIPRTDHL